MGIISWPSRSAIVFLLIASAGPAAAQTPQQLHQRITDRDRKIREQADEIERLTYAAGRAAARPAPVSLTTRQHIDTMDRVSKVEDATEDLATTAKQAARDNAEAANAIKLKLDLAKEETRKSTRLLLLSIAGGFLTLIAGLIATDLRERRNHKWALAANTTSTEQLEKHKQQVEQQLHDITALLDPQKKTADWKDLT